MPRIAYGGDELFVALGVAIMGIAELRVAEGRVDYLSVGDEVRVADAEVDDIIVFCEGGGVQRQRGGRVFGKALCNIISHFSSPFSSVTQGMTVEAFGMT